MHHRTPRLARRGLLAAVLIAPLALFGALVRVRSV